MSALFTLSEGLEVGSGGSGGAREPDTVAEAALRPESIIRTRLAGELSLVRGRSGSIVDEDCSLGEPGDALRSMFDDADFINLLDFVVGVPGRDEELSSPPEEEEGRGGVILEKMREGATESVQ